MKEILGKLLLVMMCMFIFSCGGGSKKNEGIVPEADSNVELKAEETLEEEEIKEQEDVNTDGLSEAELEIEEAEEIIAEEEKFDVLPVDENSYIAPYDPDMVVENGGIEMVVNQLLMTLEENETEKVADELAKKVKGVIVGFIYPSTYQVELETSTIDGLENAINIIEADSRVRTVVENVIFEAQAVFDIENIVKEDMWSYKRIEIVEAWKSIENNKIKLNDGIKIAIVDTGLDKNHPEFKQIKVLGINEIPGEESTNYDDDYGHGTNVAGVIAAANNGEGMNGVLTGLFTNFELHVYRASNDHGQFSMDAIYSALSHAARNGAKVVNMSFGLGYKCKDERRLTNYDAWKRIMESYKEIFSRYPDTLFVAAAGNEDINAVFQLPASTPVRNIISVAATDQNDRRSFWGIPYFSYKASNYGDNIHIAAPGTKVYTTRSCLGEYGKGNYSYIPGTSIAAPFVSGVAALLSQIDPSLTPVEVKSILVDTANEVEVMYPDGDIDDSKHTWKRLNALNAVNFVINRLKSANPEPISEQPIIEPQLLPLAEDTEPIEEPEESDPVTPPPPVNHPPVVSNVVLSGTGIYDGGTGNVTITYTLTDIDNDTCDITVEHRYALAEDAMISNLKWYSATTLEETFNVTPGNRSVTWQSGIDEPYYGSFKVRVTPTDTETGTAGISDWFEINNNPSPIITPNTPPIAEIKKPANNAVFYREDHIKFDGEGSDAEEAILSYTWTSDIDGTIFEGRYYSCNCFENIDNCNLSVGVHTITLTVQDSEGLTGTDSVTITVSDKYETFLVEEAGQLYYCQNNKVYPTDTDTVKIMADAGLSGWTTYKSNSVSSYAEGPEFVSDGVLLREIGTDPVYLLMDNKLRWIRTVEALNWMNGVLGEINYEDDIIDVPPEILAKYEHGSDIFEVGFTEAYERNLGPIEESRFCCEWKAWPGSYVSVILGFPVTEVENALQSGYSGISGTYQTFDKGAIDSSEKGAFAVYGAIYSKYKELGYSGSKLGFPISDEYGWPDGKGNTHRRSDFEGGHIYWVSSVDETYVVYDASPDNVEITFVDSELETAVRNVLSADTGPITTDMVREVTSLDIRGDTHVINDITGLEHFVNLEKLNLYKQTTLADISPLANLINLIELLLSETGVIDLTPLANLYNLRELYLYGTDVSDLGPLSDLSNLRGLYIQSNNITDVSPLGGLIRLEGLTIMGYLTISPQGYVTRGSLADISPLSNLINLTCLEVVGNVISDISALVNILDDGDILDIWVNLLDTNDCPDIQALVNKGVIVHSDVNCQ